MTRGSVFAERGLLEDALSRVRILTMENTRLKAFKSDSVTQDGEDLKEVVKLVDTYFALLDGEEFTNPEYREGKNKLRKWLTDYKSKPSPPKPKTDEPR